MDNPKVEKYFVAAQIIRWLMLVGSK